MVDWSEIRHFKASEFDSPDEPGSGEKMDQRLVDALDDLRHVLGFPLFVTSGYRTREHNMRVGGEIRSAHLEGQAVDIAMVSPHERFLLIREALDAGFRRIGIGPGYVHLDVSTSRPRDVIWTKLKTGMQLSNMWR